MKLIITFIALTLLCIAAPETHTSKKNMEKLCNRYQSSNHMPQTVTDNAVNQSQQKKISLELVGTPLLKRKQQLTPSQSITSDNTLTQSSLPPEKSLLQVAQVVAVSVAFHTLNNTSSKRGF